MAWDRFNKSVLHKLNPAHIDLQRYIKKKSSTLFRSLGKAALLLVTASCLKGCLERINPWDPVNRPLSCRADLHHLRDSVGAELHSRLAMAIAENSGTQSAHDALDRQFQVNNNLSTQNALQRNSNDAIEEANQESKAFNEGVCNLDSIALLKSLDTLARLRPPSLTIDPVSARQRVRLHSLSADSLIADVNALCDPEVVVHSDTADFFRRSFSQVSADLSRLEDSIVKVVSTLSTVNANEIQPYNDQISEHNRAIRDYNDSITFVASRGCLQGEINPDTVRTAIPLLERGDTLYVGEGTFDMTARIQNSGTADSAIVIQGSPLGRTVFTSTEDIPLIISNKDYVVVRNVVFQGSGGSGVKLEANSGTITFENCDFVNNGGYGIEAIDSDMKLINCRIMGNTLSGMRATSGVSQSQQTELRNVLIARNNLYGIDALTIGGIFENVTISHNALDGIRFQVPKRDLTLRKTLITYHQGHALNLGLTEDAIGDIFLDACNLYENESGNIFAPPGFSAVYANENPFYVAPLLDDYTIGVESALHKDNVLRNPARVEYGYRVR